MSGAWLNQLKGRFPSYYHEDLDSDMAFAYWMRNEVSWYLMLASINSKTTIRVISCM